QFADLVSSAASEGYLGERERRARSHEEATRLFVTRMLSGDLDDEEAVIREGRHFGYDLDRMHVVAVVSPRNRGRQLNVERDLELAHGRSQLQRYRPDAPAVVLRSGLIVAVPDDSVSDVASTMLKALAGVLAGQHFTSGIGTARGGPGGIVASYAEAQRAQTLASILQPKSLVCRYDELSLFDLFRAGEPVDAFVNEVLGKLIRRDRERHTEFAQTLEALFAAAHIRKLLPLVILAALMAGACQGATTSQTSKTITILSPDAVAALDNEAPGMLVLESMQAIVNLGEQLVDFKRSGNQSADGVNQLDFNNFGGRLAESWNLDEANKTWTFNLRHN